MTANLTLGVPFWATAVSTPDGIRYRRNFQYTKSEAGMLRPLGKVVRAYLDSYSAHPKATSLVNISVEDLAGESDIILTIDDQTWKDQGFWPTSDWYRCPRRRAESSRGMFRHPLLLLLRPTPWAVTVGYGRMKKRYLLPSHLQTAQYCRRC